MKSRRAEPDLLAHAREMRHSMTRQERRLWFDFLKDLPHTVHRQRVFGLYIADFSIAAKKLVIELDGSQHFEEAGKEYDAHRDAYLRGLGLTVLRYSNGEIDQNFAGVCEDILRHIEG